MKRRPAAITRAVGSGAPGRPRDPAVDRILFKAALQLFIARGIDGVSFEQVSKRTGISRSTIYRRWRDKEELLGLALRSTREPAAASAEAIRKMSPDELVALIRRFLVASFRQPRIEQLFARLIGCIPEHPRLLATYRAEFVEPMWKAIFAALERARLKGALPHAPDNDLLRDLLSGAVLHRTLMRAKPQSARDDRVWTEKLLRQLGLTPGLK